MPLLRKIFFYIFVLLYLIICPLIIVRMLGFVKDPHTGRWVKTGLIYVSSNPPGASVHINSHRMPETTPTIIRDLSPGAYDLRMELEGYKPWQNTVPVLYRKATSVENILLIPQQWRVRTLNADAVYKLIPMPGNDFLLLATSQAVRDVLILRLTREINDDQLQQLPSSDLRSLFPEESIYRDARVLRYFIVPRSPFFVMEINVEERHKYLWIDPRDEQVHIEDISDLIPQAPKKISWEPNEERNIFVFYDNAVNRLNIKEKAIYPNIALRDIPMQKPVLNPEVPQANQAFWANNSNTIIFRTAQDVFLMDAKTFGQPRLAKVMRVQEGTDVYFDERTGRLYYIDDTTQLLSSVQILHHKPFIPKPVADTLRFKQLEP